MDTDEELVRIARDSNRAFYAFIVVAVLLDIVTLIASLAVYFNQG